MSSDDSIIISKSTFKIYYIQLSQEGFGEEDVIGQCKSLEEAIKFAEDWQEKDGMYVEYGIRFIK